jgi:biotin carboxyl carrier protein
MKDEQPEDAHTNMDEKPDYQIINYEGASYKTLFSRKFQNRKTYVLRDPNKLYAFIPGTIIKVFVKEKQKVKKGEKLVVLQAMKMNNIILAPHNGIIKKVNVKPGESVPKAHLLIELK